MTYEEGFSAGEQASYGDRKAGAHGRAPGSREGGPYWRGYADGYTARSGDWAAVDTKGRPLLPPTPAPARAFANPENR